jgi:hypothetical protein
VSVDVKSATSRLVSEPTGTRPACSTHFEVDECDPNAHANYTCEQARLMAIYEDPSVFGLPMVVTRCDGPGTAARLAQLVALKKRVRAERAAADPVLVPRIVVYYLGYTRDTQVCKDFECVFVC